MVRHLPQYINDLLFKRTLNRMNIALAGVCCQLLEAIPRCYLCLIAGCGTV